MNNENEVIGYFKDKFYEDKNIPISNEELISIKIKDIKEIKLVE